MDNRLLKAGVKEIIQPLLRECGFTRFQYPNAWRRLTDQTHVLNIQSLTMYETLVFDGVFCFRVNLGVVFNFIPCYYLEEDAARRADTPREYEADIRCMMLNPNPTDADDSLWWGDYRVNLPETLAEVRRAIELSALPWLDHWKPIENLIGFLERSTSSRPKRWKGIDSAWRIDGTEKGNRRMLGYAEHYAGHEHPQVSLSEAEAIQQSFAESWRNPPGISKT